MLFCLSNNSAVHPTPRAHQLADKTEAHETVTF
jgi:hypothetical protein